MANQYSNRPPFCDFLEKFQAAHKDKWTSLTLKDRRVGLGRFDEWLKVCDYKLDELNWQNLMEFHRFLSMQGASSQACSKAVQAAKRALRWGIETGELSQNIETLYVANYRQHAWEIDLPKASLDFLAPMEVSRPGSHRHHQYAQRVFHTFLTEKKLTYRKLKPEHMIAFIKYLQANDLKLQTRMAITRNIKGFLKWLHQKRKISRLPEVLLPTAIMPKKQRNLPRPLDPDVDEKMQELLRNTPDIYYKSILLVRRTGLRISELRKLEYKCIQKDNKGRMSLRVPAVKLGIERRVPLDEETIFLIKTIQKMSIKNYKKKGLPEKLVVSGISTYPRYEKFSQAMTEICVRLKVEKWVNLHALRHTYATSMLNAGLSIVSLKEMLGHKTITMSLLYAKVSQEKIHQEYSNALLKMSTKQIPKLLETSKTSADDVFRALSLELDKSIDAATDEMKIKKIKTMKNKLAKLKMEMKNIK